jgi:carboxyl-terminal processing protease
MKNFLKIALILAVSTISIVSCTDYDDVISKTPINSFIWKGLNLYYLYQEQVPDLADSKFKNTKELNDYLSGFDNPEGLFEHLIFERQTIDKYSVLFSNYTQLEQLLQGTTKSNGVVYGLSYKTGSTTDVFGWVKYIMPNSDSSTKNITRGTIFSGVNGTALTVDNYRTLLADDTYTLNLADYNNGSITQNSQSVTLTKSIYDQNPVYQTNTFQIGSRKIGYLVYNGFFSNYETQLNDAFGNLKSQNVTDLVLDLRYNSGGSIATATRLASMITGQFAGQIFSQQQWNNKIQPSLGANNTTELFKTTLNSGEPIKSLNLTKVYILTSKSTASASELVINCLKPYINVVQIGNITTGKNVGSITMYDSPNFGKQNLNTTHTYAMQPIVLKTINKVGFGDYSQGITPENPTNKIVESIGNLSELGNPNELLLSKVLNIISNGGRYTLPNKNLKVFDEIIEKNVRNIETEMYFDLK